MKAYGFDQFDLRHNRTDIVLERMYPDKKKRPLEVQDEIARYRKYWEYRVARNSFTTDMVSGKTRIHAPEILDVRLNGILLCALSVGHTLYLEAHPFSGRLLQPLI